MLPPMKKRRLQKSTEFDGLTECNLDEKHPLRKEKPSSKLLAVAVTIHLSTCDSMKQINPRSLV